MLIVIGGATCTGKSEIAIKVAEEVGGEIISADSMQIYRHMNIGTAKLSREEMRGIPHHMIDIIEPNEKFSVAEYSEKAKNLICEIESRGKTPIMCGGTGLYINSVLYEYHLSSYDEEVRKKIYEEYKAKGIDYMYEKLLSLDPLASSIHKNNVKRVLRALEVLQLDGKSILDKSDKGKTQVPHQLYALDVPRDKLYEKINYRVDKMFAEGLPEEAERLVNELKLSFDMQSMQAIGYREFKEYYAGVETLEEVREKIKQHTRNYAKRQITWFKRMATCTWLNDAEMSRNDMIDKIIGNYYSK